jgi:peptidoglycan hydrolase-like protein with peptidoglycan-binding domain
LHRLAIGGQVYVEDGLNEHTSAAAAVRRGTSPIDNGKRPSSEQATTVAAAEAESTADAASEPADEARGVPPTNGPAHRHSGAVDAAASAAPGSARPAEVNGIESERDLVLLIQQRLDDVGLDPGPHDGKVGSRTAAAIKSYQRTHGLVTDGKATAGLLEHLTQNLAGDTGSQDPATADRSPANRDKNIVLLVQQRLLQAGFDPGKPDGIMGWRSRDAIEAYQREHGLTVDGRATPELLDRLERQLQARGTGKNGSRRKPVQEATAPIATDIIDSSSEERVKNQQTAGFRIQLAAFRSGPDAAHRELERVRREYEDLLASLPLIVTHADGGDGAIYKVQAGPLDEDRANAVCDALKQRHQGCLVIKR